MIATASASSAQSPVVRDMPPPPPAPPIIAAAPAPVKNAPAGVAAIVNGKRITRAQVASEALKVAGPQVVNQLILIELINQEAAKQHIVVTPTALKARLAEIRQQAAQRYPGGGLDYVLAQRHQTLASYTDQLTTELRVEALAARTLPPASSTVKYHARHLLVATNVLPGSPPGAKPPHTDAEALAIIAKAQAELKAGASFADVANKYTEDPSGKGNGGDLGLFDASASLDPAFKTAALALAPGQVTAVPVKSQFGYHLIKMDSTSTAPSFADRKLFADAAAGERRQQIQQNIPAYVQALRARSKVIDYLGDAPTFAPSQNAGPMPGPGR